MKIYLNNKVITRALDIVDECIESDIETCGIFDFEILSRDKIVLTGMKGGNGTSNSCSVSLKPFTWHTHPILHNGKPNAIVLPSPGDVAGLVGLKGKNITDLILTCGGITSYSYSWDDEIEDIEVYTKHLKSSNFNEKCNIYEFPLACKGSKSIAARKSKWKKVFRDGFDDHDIQSLDYYIELKSILKSVGVDFKFYTWRDIFKEAIISPEEMFSIEL